MHREEHGDAADLHGLLSLHRGIDVLSADRAASSSRVIVSWSKPLPQYAGQDLDDIASEMGVTRKRRSRGCCPRAASTSAWTRPTCSASCGYDKTMIGSDGLPHDASPHPRLWGTFPRVLGHYGRDCSASFRWRPRCYKMTGLTAKNFGLEGPRRAARRGAMPT